MVNQKNFIEGLRGQKSGALDFFIDNYSNLIFKVAYGILNNRELSEECLNDVLLKVWDNAKYFNKDSSQFTTWVMAISKYTAIDILRKEERHSKNIDISQVKVDSKEYLENIIENKESLELLKTEIGEMKAVDREIFLRKFYLGDSNKEIGESLGITDKFINLRIFRGRKKLQAKLRGEEI